MDNFLHSFKNKVNQAEEHDALHHDWENFKAFRKAAGAKKQASGQNDLNKKRITAVAAIFILGISLFAYFVLPKNQTKPEIAINKTENKEQEGLINTEHEILTDVSDHSDGENFTASQDKMMEKTSISPDWDLRQQSATKTPLSQPKETAANFDRKTGDLSAISGQTQSLLLSESIQKKEEFAVTKDPQGTDISGLNHGKRVELANTDFGNLPGENIVLADIPMLKLNNRSFSIKNPVNAFVLPASFLVFSSEKSRPVRTGFQISGAARFTYAIKDRIDATFYQGKHLAASYYLTDKLSLGINWTNSRYSLTIPDKELYPVLEDINPRSVSDTLEELTVNASLTKLGLELNYELLNYTKVKSSLGIGVSRDISTKHDFRMKVRDRYGKPEFQHQNKNIIAKSRVFVSPSVRVAYNAYDRLWVYGKAQYDISLSKYQEKYLGFDLGLAYVF